MRNVLRISTLFAIVSGLALAETYAGKLIDADCATQKKTACAATTATTSFALSTSGKLLKFDAAGNAKAAEAMKESNSGANRARDPNAPASTDVSATVSGTASGDQLNVESIRLE